MASLVNPVAALASSSFAHVSAAQETDGTDVRFLANDCHGFVMQNKVFPLAPDNQLRVMLLFSKIAEGSIDFKTLIDSSNKDLLAFVVFAAIIKPQHSTSILPYIKQTRADDYPAILKIAVDRGLKYDSVEFSDALLSDSIKPYWAPEALAHLLLSPDDINLSLRVLNRADAGFFRHEDIVAAVQSAVDYAGCESAPLAEGYVGQLLSSIHNTCQEADYIQIFIDSCAKNSPGNESGLRALLSRLSVQGVTDLFSSIANRPAEIAQKALPIIFEVRGHDMDTEAVIQCMEHGNAIVLSAAQNCPALWNRIPHAAADGDVVALD